MDHTSGQHRYMYIVIYFRLSANGRGFLHELSFQSSVQRWTGRTIKSRCLLMIEELMGTFRYQVHRAVSASVLAECAGLEPTNCPDDQCKARRRYASPISLHYTTRNTRSWLWRGKEKIT